MIARYENRSYAEPGGVWVGRYRNASNLLHWHYDCELISVQIGRCAITAAGRSYMLSEGQSAFLMAGIIHSITSENGCEICMCRFDPQIAAPVLQESCLKRPLLRRDYHVFPIIAAIDREQRERKLYSDLKIRALILSLMIDLFRSEETVPVDRYSPMHALTNRFGELLESVDRDYATMTCPRAAAIMGYTPNYFSGLFRKMTGIPFSLYVNEIKVEKAMRLLREEHCPISEIAVRCGFNTTRNFNRVFKEIMGMTPREAADAKSDRPKDARPRRFDPSLEATQLLPILPSQA